MNQRSLFAADRSLDPPDPPVVEPRIANNPDRDDLRRRAREWMDNNPRVVDLFVELASNLASKEKRFGAKYLAETVRWEYRVRYDEEFKINNNYVAYVAREIVARRPEMRRWLKFRETRW